ncbi:unnamed protein product [Lactuca virosa]|uniref:Uncharacterized protein n=1 Tax=Lactuca virosa TaxID=75947 RepID=A0AAU9MGI8_9ASTR|nr:unnamed protein product [Lactuca virosa]
MPHRRRDPRPGVLITEPVQQSVSIVEPAQVQEDVQIPIIEPAPVQEDVQGQIAESAQVHQDAQSPNFNDNFNFIVNEETYASGSSSAPPPPEHDDVSIKPAKILAFQDSIPQLIGKGIYIGYGQGVDEESQHTISELRQEILILKQESIEKDLLIGNSESGKAPETSERVVVRPAPDSTIDQYLSSGPATVEEKKEK